MTDIVEELRARAGEHLLLAEAAAEIERLRATAAAAWQPMATAPKDEGPLLLYCPGLEGHAAREIVVGAWKFDANRRSFGYWTSDVGRAMRMSKALQFGCVWVNDHIPIISEMPHGGYGHSGFGKDMSAYSFDEYTNVKHVMHDITGTARKAWHRTIFSLPG